MKKRIISVVLLVAMLTSLLAGCGNNVDSKVTENKIDYDYYQDLNVIDDNYRNYYEIFVYSFYDSNGDGIGDLQGVIEKLDYIEYMGFNGIWLMPIMKSTTYHKYDVVDYYTVDYEYGTMEDFEQLIEECHKRDINVVIDFVMNHTSSSHQWFKEATKYLRGLPKGAEPDLKECPYVEYYNFKQTPKGGTFYGVNSNWYYEGEFWSEMPDLNFESEALREEFKEIAKFWIDKGVDGFRMDAVMHIYEDQTDKNNELLDWFYSYCKELNPDFYMVSEVWANQSVIQAYYESNTPSMFNFTFGQAEGHITKTAKGAMTASTFIDQMITWDEENSATTDAYIDAPFLTNHDNVRISNSLNNNEDLIKFAGGIMMTMNGSPFVYYGEEIGMTSAGDKDENKRLPLNWSDASNTGETGGPAGCNLSLQSAFEGVEEQLADGHSILNYYRRAIRLRNENPELARGDMKKIDSLCTESVGTLTKTYEESTIAVIYNTSEEVVELTLTDSEIAEMEIRGYLTLNGEKITLKNGVLTLPARSICILK